MSLENSRYIVTGAASGIGRATGRKLVAAGAEVISLDRNEPDYPVTAHYAVDLSDPASIDAVVARLAEGGPYSGLLNIAGVPGGSLPDAFVVSVNYLGLRHLTEAVEPLLAPGGNVTNVSSNGDVLWPTREDVHRELYDTAGFAEGVAWYAEGKAEGKAYNFSKEAVSYYTIRKAIEYAQKGKRINAISPGMTNTPIIGDFLKVMTEDRVERIRNLVGGFAEPDTIADALVFMASPAARFVNGQVLDVDGGLKAGMRAGDVPYPGRA
ncbi:coniferyl-alcohol dehydrogenase [Microbacterium sp. SLBN-111]|uniref:coniferyl-alcohol dehydrogenase n=1 Tax=Microbacterium sp. SLBN-111 TaxID=3377733 RepID=UPI003C77B9CA